MSDRVTITIDGEAQLQARLGGALRRLENPGGLLDAIGTAMEQNIQFRFDTKQAPDGTPWLPISRTTRDIYGSDWFKKRNPAFAAGVPGSLLERTRFMRNSLTHNAGDDFVEWGFSDPKAAFHEFGTRTMPRRQLLTDDPVAGTLAEQDRADILAEISGYLSDVL